MNPRRDVFIDLLVELAERAIEQPRPMLRLLPRRSRMSRQVVALVRTAPVIEEFHYQRKVAR